MSGEDLPVILLSAADAAAADSIIADLIDKEVVGDTDNESSSGRVWELTNKYYTASVRLVPQLDDSPLVVTDPEAHVIYLTENECSVAGLERRAAGAGAGAARCDVKLALCACAGDDIPPDLRSAARALQYELVGVRESDSPPSPGPFPRLRGLRRAREALHAHTWPGLRLHRADTAAPLRNVPPARAQPDTHDDDFSPFQAYQNGAHGSDSESEPDEEEMVRRAELFAEALGAVEGVRGGAGAGAGGGGGAGADAGRRARAEQLLAAFCRALGTDIDRL